MWIYAFEDADLYDDVFDPMACRHGRATAIDPDVIQIGDTLVKALKKINFLKDPDSFYKDDESSSICYNWIFGTIENKRWKNFV